MQRLGVAESIVGREPSRTTGESVVLKRRGGGGGGGSGSMIVSRSLGLGRNGLVCMEQQERVCEEIERSHYAIYG
jgi:hypothetical protein